MVISSYVKANNVLNTIKDDYGQEMANTFFTFFHAYEAFRDKMKENGFQTSLGIDENIFVGDDDISLSVLCFKNVEVLVRAYPLQQLSMLHVFDVKDQCGNDYVPFYLQLCKDFQNMCNIL